MFEVSSDTATRTAIDNAHRARGQMMANVWGWLFPSAAR